MRFTVYICHSLFTVTSLHKSQYLGCYVSVVKNLPANGEDAGDAGSVPVSRRSPGEGNGYLLQYSCLGNPRSLWAIVHGPAKNQKQLVTKQEHSEALNCLTKYF